MFWIGIVVIFIFSIGLTEIMVFLLKPVFTMIKSNRKRNRFIKQHPKQEYPEEELEEEEEYYNVPVMVSSYTVDLSGVRNQIQKIDAEEIEILEFEDEIDRNQTEELI